jgi:hypothetical protein
VTSIEEIISTISSDNMKSCFSPIEIISKRPLDEIARGLTRRGTEGNLKEILLTRDYFKMIKNNITFTLLSTFCFKLSLV